MWLFTNANPKLAELSQWLFKLICFPKLCLNHIHVPVFKAVCPNFSSIFCLRQLSSLCIINGTSYLYVSACPHRVPRRVLHDISLLHTKIDSQSIDKSNLNIFTSFEKGSSDRIHIRWSNIYPTDKSIVMYFVDGPYISLRFTDYHTL